MQQKLIGLHQFKKIKQLKMIIVILIASAIAATLMWKYLGEDPADNLQIPQSSNYTYQTPRAIAPSDIINQIESNIGKPILLHLYTTWCGICKKQLPVINEMSRKFQNTDLKVIIVAIDRNIDSESLKTYLEYHKNIYFEPQFLVYNDGLSDLLSQKNIRYNRVVPLTVLIDRSGKVDLRFTGYKKEHYVNRKIIKSLIFQNDQNI
ncbi:MAG: thiol-disulfide isomerase/thioredoxin [Lentimonas sp.]